MDTKGLRKICLEAPRKGTDDDDDDDNYYYYDDDYYIIIIIIGIQVFCIVNGDSLIPFPLIAAEHPQWPGAACLC